MTSHQRTYYSGQSLTRCLGWAHPSLLSTQWLPGTMFHPSHPATLFGTKTALTLQSEARIVTAAEVYSDVLISAIWATKYFPLSSLPSGRLQRTWCAGVAQGLLPSPSSPRVSPAATTHLCRSAAFEASSCRSDNRFSTQLRGPQPIPSDSTSLLDATHC